MIPHIGGRRANLDYFDSEVMPLIEIASAHGWFEWVWQEALERGLITGFAAGSDDHTGRPGTSRPTNGGMFGVGGGLLGTYAPSLQRRSIWDAIRARHTFASTGARMILNLTADGHPMGEVFCSTQPPVLNVKVAGAAPLEKVEVLRGTTVVYSHPLAETDRRPAYEGPRRLARLAGEGPHPPPALGRQLARGQRAAFFRQAAGHSTIRPEGIIEQNEESVRWVSQTSGDWDGVALELDGNAETSLTFTSAPATFTVRLDELADKDELVRPGHLPAWAARSASVATMRSALPYDTLPSLFKTRNRCSQDVTPYFRACHPIRRRDGVVQSGLRAESMNSSRTQDAAR